MDKAEIEKHRIAQNLAKETMEHLRATIRSGMSEAEIAGIANDFMSERRATFWYHGKGALVLVGERTVLSISGKDYRPSDQKLQGDDFLTVDLSPAIDGYWGDYARSLVIKDGRVSTDCVDHRYREELIGGLCQVMLYQKHIANIVKEDMTYGELYHFMDYDIMWTSGFVNLDFRGNYGHSIERKLEDRVFVEEGSQVRIADHPIFTIEPHIRFVRGKLGYKCEDIYCIDGNTVHLL